MTEVPTIYQLTDNGTAPKFNAAFAKGCGGQIVKDGVLRPGPVALWGEHKFFRTLHRAIGEGRTWYYGDHAYFGRGIYFRVTKNALQVHGSFFDHGPNYVANMDRMADVAKVVPVDIQPKKPEGQFLLVCPPSEQLSERSGFTQKRWIDFVLHGLAGLTERRLVLRTKPKINRTPKPLLKALEGAYALITYTSNAAVEALCAGYPVITTGPCPTNVFGGTELAAIRRPLYVPDVPTRRAWAAMLCANQWTLEEIARGDCWNAIK